VRTASRAAAAIALALVVLAGPVSAAASVQTVAQAAAAQSTITGRVTDARGAALAGAVVTAEGAGATHTATTDASGNFSLTLGPGLYSVTVSHGGFQSAQSDLAVTGTTAQHLDVTLTESSLQSLRVIGRTGTNLGARAPFNVSEAAVSALPAQEIGLRQNINLTDVVANLPGVTVSRGFSTTPNTSFAVRGLPLQTRTLIDGHPVSSGIAGQWNSNYALSSMFENVDVIKGTGLNGAIAGESAVGTVNLRTRDFTQHNSAGATIGDDTYGGQFFNAFADVNFLNGKASLIVQKAYQGFNGPWNGYFGNRQGAAAAVPIGTNVPPNYAGLDQWQGDYSNRYALQGELVKGRYRFSESTSLTLEYLGLQGQYSPQGGAYGTYNGQMTLQACENGTKFQPTLATCNASSVYTAPYTYGQIGQTVSGYTWFPNSFIQNNEPQFAAELRTSIKNDTVLFRPYTHLINRFISGAWENQYPGNSGGWYAVTNAANCGVQFYAPGAKGAPSSGAAGPCFSSTMSPNSAAYVGANPTLTAVFPTTTTAPACSATPPYTCFTTPTAIQNNGQYGYGTPFSQPELDKLNGYTFTYIHPSGENTYSLSYDYRKDYTQSESSDTTLPAPGCQYVIGSVSGAKVFQNNGTPFQPGCSTAQYAASNPASTYNLLPRSPIGTPPTVSQYSDIALTGLFQLSPRLRLALGNYFEIWHLDAQIEDPAVLAQYAALGTSAAAPVALISGKQRYSHYDPHVGLEWRASPTLSVRFNGGSSITEPYPSILSGFGSITLPNAANGNNYTNSIPNFNLKPETTVAYDLGFDNRLRDGSVFSVDAYDITVHDVFLSQQSTIAPIPGITANNFFQTNYVNGPLERSYGLEAAVFKNPTVGWGWYLTGSLNRSYYDQLPLSLYTGNTSPTNVNYNINGVQLWGVPFWKSYGQVFYNLANGIQYEFGVSWEGQNNALYGPSYFLGDAAVRVPLGDKRVHLQASFQNLFDYNPTALGRALGNQGNVEPGVYLSNGQLIYAGPINPATGGPNTAVATGLFAPPPRTIRLSLQFGM
jgi:outer membrane receptor protein involved in Fe transport